jgi:hypothetical protein
MYSTSSTTSTISTSVNNDNFAPPYIQLKGVASTAAASKVKRVYGMTAFMEIGLARGDVKYKIEKKCLVPMLPQDYAITVPGIGQLSYLGISRKQCGASNEDLDFLDEEIPKFIRWYLWDENTSDEAGYFFEKVVLKGLTTLKDVTYKDKPEVGERISYWITLVKLSIAKPVNRSTMEQGLQNFLTNNSMLNDKIVETTNNLNGTDTTFGGNVKNLVTKDKFKEIIKLFETRNSPNKIKENDLIANTRAIEKEIQNLNQHHKNSRKLAIIETVKVSEAHSFQPSNSSPVSIAPLIKKRSTGSNPGSPVDA